MEVEVRSREDRAKIHEVLPRRSQFVRKAPGKVIHEQVIAANIDLALVVTGLDGDFNPRRIERYLAQCWESGARPVVVLNKADLCPDVEDRLREIERIGIATPVCALSAKTGQGVDAFSLHLEGGKTVVFLGSSGAGKSTLVNRMMQRELQPTQLVRASDSRGRHTTTSPQLFALPNGTLIIDTPGLRELQLWDATEGLSRAFADIEALAVQCRFRDCRHNDEPGCVVQAALQAGSLDAGRLENQRKLEREQEFLMRKRTPEIRSAEKKRIKLLQRELRRKYRQRDKARG